MTKKGMGIIVTVMVAICMTGMAKMTNAQETPKGKQILKTIELPASTSNWNNKIDQLGDIKPLDMTKKETLSYWLFLPTTKRAAEDGRFPLLLFLHGAGERGSNPKLVKVHGPAKMLDTDKADQWPFITVSPQCPNGKYWSPAQLLLLLDDIEKNYPVDRSRVYVTGLSMGGFGSWMLLHEAPNRFAAAIPICGGANVAWADRFVNIPIRVFHGDADGAVNPKYSIDLVAAIQKAGGKKVSLKLYPGVGHNSWVKAYAEPDWIEWLLSCRLAQ